MEDGRPPLNLPLIKGENQKRNRVVTIILGGLLILAVILHFIKSGPASSAPLGKAGELNKVEIKNLSSGKSFLLLKKNDEWQVFFSTAENIRIPDGETGYFADVSKVKRLTGNLSELKFETVISEDEGRHFYYSVSTANALSLKVSSRREIPEIYIGKSGADWSHFYARFAAKPQIYLASGLIRGLITQNEDYYRERKIVSEDENDIKQLTVEEPGGKKYSVERSSSGWKFDGALVSPENFAEVSGFSREMQAAGFSESGFKEKIKITIEKIDGRSVSWSIGEKEENYYTAVRDGRIGVYKIPTEKAEKIFVFLDKNGAKRGGRF